MTKITFILLLLLKFIPCANEDNETVYICTGTYSKCYHKTELCEGLDNCGREIKKVTKEDAINKYQRKACKYCYGK